MLAKSTTQLFKYLHPCFGERGNSSIQLMHLQQHLQSLMNWEEERRYPRIININGLDPHNRNIKLFELIQEQ